MLTVESQKLVSRAELARLKGVSRGAVTRACRPGGALFAARAADRVDLAHPACRAWLGLPPRADGPRRLVTFEDLSAETGIPVEELERDRHLFADGVCDIDVDHPATTAFLAEHGVTNV